MLLKADKNKRPRLNVFRSLAHIYVQIIDDDKGVNIVETESFDELWREAAIRAVAKKVGAAIAKKALAAGITEVDSNVTPKSTKAELKLLEALREAGLKF